MKTVDQRLSLASDSRRTVSKPRMLVGCFGSVLSGRPFYIYREQKLDSNNLDPFIMIDVINNLAFLTISVVMGRLYNAFRDQFHGVSTISIANGFRYCRKPFPN